jgi:transposase
VGYNLIPCDRNQQLLMPPSLDEWLPEDHLARFVVDVVEVLDLSAFYARRRDDGWGRAAYDPKMMVELLIYAYATGVRSSRAIERHCIEDVAFRFIAANEHPDHATIARFAADHATELADLFEQSLVLAAKLGLVKVGLLALDSTRMKANASPGANRTEEGLRAEIERILAEARARDAAEDQAEATEDNIPEELVDPRSRFQRLVAAKARLDEERAAVQRDYEAKLAKAKEREARTGKPHKGRTPKPPDQRTSFTRKSRKANITDPDSRVMSAPSGGYLQGYNVQAMATEDQIVIACGVTNRGNDYDQLVPMMEQARHNLAVAEVSEPSGVLVADSGYLTDANLNREEKLGIELLVATRKHSNNVSDPRRSDRKRRPSQTPPKQRMAAKFTIERNKMLYKRRACSIEPVFAQQRQRGAGRFRRRGIAAGGCEWRFENGVHNLLKIRTLRSRSPAPRPSTAIRRLTQLRRVLRCPAQCPIPGF